MIVAMWITTALAGDGPWALQPGASSAYFGTYQQRFRKVDTTGGGESLEDGVVTNAFTGVVTLGLADRVEVEAGASFARSRHLDPASLACTRPGRPEDFCDLSQGLNATQLSVKGLLLDEAQLRPLSVALSGRFRSTDWVNGARGRLTALGEGQSDVGAVLSAGRTATLGGRGWYRVSADVGYWYRFALALEPKVPGDDIQANLAALVSPTGPWAIGPNLDLLYRLQGTDLSMDVDLSSPNGFASLQVAQLKAGGTASISGSQGLTVSASAYGTLWAMNNPTDAYVVAVGVGYYRPPGGRGSE